MRTRSRSTCRACARSSSPAMRRSSRCAGSAIFSSSAMRSSLRLQLLAWLLVPLGFLVAVNTWLSFPDAAATATAVKDPMLLGAVRIIAEQTHYRAGALHVEMPPAAPEPFESAVRGPVYYRG